jgi:hypothetical protein
MLHLQQGTHNATEAAGQFSRVRALLNAAVVLAFSKRVNALGPLGQVRQAVL